jgi:hypothetical protein
MIGTALYNIEVVRVCYSKTKAKVYFLLKSRCFFLIRLNEKKKHVVVQ